MIDDIQPSYYFNPKTGYLIPSWQIQADFISENGQNYIWPANIDATK